jgi:hypothetical protein
LSGHPQLGLSKEVPRPGRETVPARVVLPLGAPPGTKEITLNLLLSVTGGGCRGSNGKRPLVWRSWLTQSGKEKEKRRESIMVGYSVNPIWSPMGALLRSQDSKAVRDMSQKGRNSGLLTGHCLVLRGVTEVHNVVLRTRREAREREREPVGGGGPGLRSREPFSRVLVPSLRKSN